MQNVNIVGLIFAIAVCALVAWVVTQHSVAKMKTARSRSQACDYYQNGSFELIDYSDEFVDSKTEVKSKAKPIQKGGKAHAG